jgi:hypothetical protein
MAQADKTRHLQPHSAHCSGMNTLTAVQEFFKNLNQGQPSAVSVSAIEDTVREYIARNQKLSFEAKQEWCNILLKDPLLADLKGQ